MQPSEIVRRRREISLVFKDGTANVTTEKEFDKVVWTDSKDWMKGGSYMALRLVQMHLETWDRTNLQEQAKHLWSL